MADEIGYPHLPGMNYYDHASDDAYEASTVVAGNPSAGSRNAEPFKTSIPEQPVTQKRKPFLPSSDSALTQPGTARATLAASRERPNGAIEDYYASAHQHQTVIQQHVEYFDKDRDGIIWPLDTYLGCRQFGWAPLLSALIALVIHLALSYPTVSGFLPDPFFRIYVQRVYKCKHGSDSMTYDNEGRFKPQSFEDIFAKYDQGNKGGLDWSDVLRLLEGQRLIYDFFFGWGAALLEWSVTYFLFWPEDGIMRKEDVRGIYDGSMFYKKAREHQAKENMKNSGTA